MGNPTDDKSRSQRGYDPRLKSFLRQARGVIAAERGLSAQCQVKLRSLANALKLPDELFQRGLEELKQINKPSEIDRWEKSFVEFLDREFSKLSSGIVSISTESRAVDLAKRKYQINEIRARQLISERADSLGLGRVAPDDAKQYVEQLILTRIGNLKTVDGSLRDQFYQTGITWGLERGDVDALVLEQLVRNRKAEAGRRRRKWAGVLMTVLAVCAVGYMGQYYEWWPTAYSMLFPVAKSDPPRIASSSSGNEPVFEVEWWNKELSETVSALISKHRGLRSTIELLGSPIEEARADGLFKFAEFACRKSDVGDQEIAAEFAKVFSLEPQPQVASSALEQFLVKLAPKKNRLPGQQENASAFQMQRFLNRLWFETVKLANRNKRLQDRSLLVSDAIMAKFGIRPDDLAPDELGQKTEALLAQDQWDQIIQNSWTSPVRASVLVQLQYELSFDKMDRTLLNRFRERAVETILQLDEGRWKDLRVPIEGAIAVSDELKVIRWIETYQTSNVPAFQDFLGRLLIEKTNVVAESSQRSDVSTALTRARTEYLTRRLQPIVVRNELASKFSTRSKRPSGVQAFDITPAAIAKLAFAANSSITCANALYDRDHDFGRFDYWTDDGAPDLTDFFPIRGKEDDVGAGSTTTASASENRSKREALAQLRDFRSSSTSARQTTIEQLARIARRFEDVSYLEAVSLADYLLSNMPLEEWLNVEKNLSEFAHWPNLGLAIADRIPLSTVKLDQALTLFNLLFNGDYSIADPAQWRVEFQREFYRRVALDLATREQTQSPRSLEWSSLESYLSLAYEFRYRQLGTYNPAQKMPTISATSDWAIANAKVVLKQVDAPSFENVKWGIVLIDSSDFSDIEKTVMANQTLARVTASQLIDRFPDKKWEIEAIASEYLQLSNTFESVGQRLYLTELMLLKLWDLKRMEAYRHKFEKAN